MPSHLVYYLPCAVIVLFTVVIVVIYSDITMLHGK